MNPAIVAILLIFANNIRCKEKFDTKEFLTSTSKSLFGVIPFAGTAFTELVFEYNGRIKQKRLNKFIELLIDNLKIIVLIQILKILLLRILMICLNV